MPGPRPIARTRAALAATLVLLQMLGAGAVVLAEAAEPVVTASHVEGQHEAGCPVLHDAIRCALCHYAGSRVALQPSLLLPAATPSRVRPARPDPIAAAPAAVYHTAPARAPPADLS